MSVYRSVNLKRLALVSLALFLGGCIWLVQRVEVQDLDTRALPTKVESPVKAHLLDGSVVTFPQGVSVSEDALLGAGTHYSLTLEPTPINRVPLDRVAALESYETRVREAESILASALTTPVAVMGGIVLFKALFGSCPTIYAPGDQGAMLEAEAFSHSIAPLFEVPTSIRFVRRPTPQAFWSWKCAMRRLRRIT